MVSRNRFLNTVFSRAHRSSIRWKKIYIYELLAIISLCPATRHMELILKSDAIFSSWLVIIKLCETLKYSLERWKCSSTKLIYTYRVLWCIPREYIAYNTIYGTSNVVYYVLNWKNDKHLRIYGKTRSTGADEFPRKTIIKCPRSKSTRNSFTLAVSLHCSK